MRTSDRLTHRSGWWHAATAVAAVPLVLAACTIVPGRTYVTPQRGEERPAPFYPATADLSGVWELIQPANGPPGQPRGRGREEGGPPGRAVGRRTREAAAAEAPRRLHLVQTGQTLSFVLEGGVLFTLFFDGRPAVVTDPISGARGQASGVWRSRRFELRVEYAGGRVVTEWFEVSRDGATLTVRTREWGGDRSEGPPPQARLVYRRAAERAR